jgi:hypothetical protein
MSDESNPIVDLENFVGSIVFERKEQVSESLQTLTLEEQMLYNSNEVLGIKVMSVVLPPNYDPELRKEPQITEWLQNKVKNNHISAHILALKYGEKLKVKLEQKEPYNNN